jgi:hypothetical protein
LGIIAQAATWGAALQFGGLQSDFNKWRGDISSTGGIETSQKHAEVVEYGAKYTMPTTTENLV